MSPIIATQGIPELAPVKIEPSGQSTQGGFDRVLEHVDRILKQADKMAAGYAEGKVGLTQAVLASEQADTTFQFVMAVRNRALTAYQQIMNMQV